MGSLTKLYLSDSDTSTQRAVNLMGDDGTNGMFVLADSFKAPPPDPVKAENDPATRRQITMDLFIHGGTTPQLDAYRRSILAYLPLARRAVGQPGGYWSGTPIVLWASFLDGPAYVYFDVTSGTLTEKRRDFGPGRVQIWTLNLECLPYARGPQVLMPSNPATVTSGTSCSLFVDNVPGDVDALAQAIFVDTSDNTEYVNKIRLSRRGKKWMASGDFSPFIAATALSPGSQVADTAGMDGAHAQSLTCTGAWQDCAQIAGGGSGLNDPYADVWVQCKTTSSVLGIPASLNGSVVMTGGGMTETYTYLLCVTAVDGSGHETAASDVLPITVPHVSGASTASAPLTWTDTGSPSNHAIYYQSPNTTPTWRRFLTGSASASYTFLGSESVTTASPPASTDSNLVPPQIRAAVALNTATPEWGPAGDPVSLVLGASFEWVYVGRFPLPPGARMEGYSSLGWLVKVQGQSPSGSTQTLKVGGIHVVPATEPSIVAERAGMADTTLRRWVFGNRRDRRPGGIVTDTSTPPVTTGILVPRGEYYLAPGGNMVGVQLYGVSGEANAGHLKGTLQFAVTPRYLDVAAVPS